MAYLLFSVGGNPEFGGFLSVDGEPSILMQDDMVYELASGLHVFKIHSTSDAQRAAGRRQKSFSNLFGDGGALDTLSRVQANNAIGDEWSFQVRAGDDEAVVIEIVSNGNDIVSTPQYRVTQVDEETREGWDNTFEEQRRIAAEEEAEKERKREEERNSPRKSLPKIIVGAIVGGYGALLTLILGISSIVSGAFNPAVVVSLIALVVGAFLLRDGIKKKIRK